MRLTKRWKKFVDDCCNGASTVIMIQASARGHPARKLFCSLLLLQQEEEDDEIIMTFVDDDDYNDDGIPAANEKRARYTVLGKDDLTDQLVDENGAMRKAATDIMMSVLRHQESPENNEL